MTIHYNRTYEKWIRRKLRQEQTEAEEKLWEYIRNRKLKVKFKRQYSIDKFCIDFYAPEIKLAIELDGSIHDLKEQKENDESRQNYIERFGIKFLRIKNEDVLNNIGITLKRIREEIEKLL